MMEKLPAKVGWLWIKEGFALFRKQPAELSTLFFGYMFLMLAIGMVPLLGQVLPLILIPIFSITFMQAAAYVEIGRKVYPNLLLTGFRSAQVRTLLQLGLLYLVAAIIAIGASALIDGGTFWQAITGRMTVSEQTVRNSNMSMAMLFAAVVYIPAAMAFWYAAPLIAWQKMGLGKAIFFSFYAVRRAGKAFIVFGLAWVALNIVLPAIVSTLVGMLTGSATAAMFTLLPLSVVLTVIMYCSFYPTYTRMFGDPPDFSPVEASA
jgi:hypothetical protein